MELGINHLLDPRLVPLVEESRSFYLGRRPGRGPADETELQAVRAHLPTPAVASPPPVVEVVAVGDHMVPLRLHVPTGQAAMGVVLEIHGGGFYLGSAADSDVRNRRLADGFGVVVASVDYRLAPEHPWPAAPADCEVAARWLAEHSQDRFGTSDLFVVGFSAGATLAATTLLRRGTVGCRPSVAPCCSSAPTTSARRPRRAA